MTKQVQVHERVPGGMRGSAAVAGGSGREVCRPERRRGPRPVRPGAVGAGGHPLAAGRAAGAAAACASGSPELAVRQPSAVPVGWSAAVRRFVAALSLLVAVAATVVVLGVVAALAGEGRGAEPVEGERVVLVSPAGVAGVR